ncbi:MAG: photosystem II reaction center protein Ycf12 [Cyanobacteriota bacterium]|nr:photosystem II reaction center protein Ycf12 [Cyanobacteriota bacterium]
MDFVNGILDGLLSFDYEPFIKIFLVGLVILSGPIVVFVLAVRGGDM